MTGNGPYRPSNAKRFIVGSVIVVITVASTAILLAISKQKASSRGDDKWERIYEEVSSARVFVNEKLSPLSNMYRANSGRVLVQVMYPNMEVIYVIFPESDEVYWADGFSFRKAGGKMELIKSPPHIKPINKAMASTTPDLIVKDNYLEFKAAKDERVSATW